MNRPKTCITNLETGEVIIREYNDEEMIEHNALLAKIKQDKIKEKTKEEAKNALLEKLGITAEEAKLLLS